MATVTPTIPHNASTSTSNNKEEPIRKRTRATAEQLAVLEDMFAVNVSPNSKIRKQLADQLQMTDRSIQIWFQNRRAKVKHMQKRAQLQMHQANMRAQLYHYQQQHYYLQQHYAPHQRAHSLDSYNYHHSTATPPFATTSSAAAANTSSSNGLGLMDQQRQSVPPCLPYAADLNSDPWRASVSPPSINNTTIDPTHLTMGSANMGLSISSLTIGQWHRLKCNRKTWNAFINLNDNCFAGTFRRFSSLQNGNPGDKYSAINLYLHIGIYESPSCHDDNLSSTTAMAGGDLHLELYHSPLFYMKHQQEWISCRDFTEHQQASQVLHHMLKGVGLTLWQELSMLMATYPETQQWIQLAPSPSFSSSSVSSASVSSLNGLVEETSILKNDYQQQQQQQQPMLLPPQTIEMTPTLSTSESSSTSASSSSSSSSSKVLSVLTTSSSSTASTSSSLLPIAKHEDPFTTVTTSTSVADDFLIDPSLLDPSLWPPAGFITS
ncbi:unnamed protein product [Absidia cylindrospora]